VQVAALDAADSGIASQQREAWIETKGASSIQRPPPASPPSNGRRGLKQFFGAPPVTGWRSIASQQREAWIETARSG